MRGSLILIAVAAGVLVSFGCGSEATIEPASSDEAPSARTLTFSGDVPHDANEPHVESDGTDQHQNVYESEYRICEGEGTAQQLARTSGLQNPEAMTDTEIVREVVVDFWNGLQAHYAQDAYQGCLDAFRGKPMRERGRSESGCRDSDKSRSSVDWAS